MRFLIISFLALFSCVASAAEITCYSSGHLIYSGRVIDPEFDGIIFSFKEPKSHQWVYMTADCIVKV